LGRLQKSPTSDIRATVMDPWVRTQVEGDVESTVVIGGGIKEKKKKLEQRI